MIRAPRRACYTGRRQQRPALPQDPEHAPCDIVFVMPLRDHAAIEAAFGTVKAGG